MKKLVKYQLDGKITSISSFSADVGASSETITDGLQEVIIDFNQPVDLKEDYISEGAIVKRPVLGFLRTVSRRVDEDWVVGTLPEGTGVYIDGILVGETDETELVLSFPLAQTYSVRFDPPFPYKTHEMEVVVNEANT